MKKIIVACCGIILLTITSLYGILYFGEKGELQSDFIREQVFPKIRTATGVLTNLKFKVRGAVSPKNPVVIVAIDDMSVENYGRWPWHRDLIAILIDQIMKLGAKSVGLDIVFSEPDIRIFEQLREILIANHLEGIIETLETDPFLASVIEKYQKQVALGWMSQLAPCQPSYHSKEECPVRDPETLKTIPAGFDRYAIFNQNQSQFDPEKTPIVSMPAILPNIPDFQKVAEFSGYFNAEPDPDGYIRRTNLVQVVGGKIYPSLPLALAQIILGDKLVTSTDLKNRIEKLIFEKSGHTIPVSPQGVLEINFRGPGGSFPYVSASTILDHANAESQNRLIASKIEKFADLGSLKDAHVLIGATALGVWDMRAFPFDSRTAGVEGHATVLDNLLSQDYMVPTSTPLWISLLVLLTVGAFVFSKAVHRLEAIPALIVFIGFVCVLGVVDFKILFPAGINLNSIFLYVEYFMLFVFLLGAKYVAEENQKKFIRGAFGKYVSPAMVDSIVHDPSKLALGGEKKELTILFSDIRGFTTLSEKLEAKKLSLFLNDYLGDMTDIIVLKTQGTLDKYIGDAIMAFWGAPIAQENHAYNAIQAAIEMQRRIASMRGNFKNTFGIDVTSGIGIHTGLVSVGNMGSKRNFNYTVIGDDVNLASRLEGLTKFYGVGIVTSQQTLSLLKTGKNPVPPHRTLDRVRVKGKKQPVDVIQIFSDPISEKGLELFESARHAYLDKDWHKAIEKFEQASSLFVPDHTRGDQPCQIYLNRINELLENPPDDSWDGIFEMETK